MTARQPGEPRVVGRKQAAAIVGVKGPNLAKTKGCPKPYQQLASGPVYRVDDMIAFAAEFKTRKR